MKTTYDQPCAIATYGFKEHKSLLLASYNNWVVRSNTNVSPTKRKTTPNSSVDNICKIWGKISEFDSPEYNLGKK